MRSSLGLAAWKAELRDSSGHYRTVVFVFQEMLQPWLRFSETKCFAPTTASQYADAICRLIDFVVANGHRYSSADSRGKLAPDFASALFYGTIADGGDPTGLWWTPSSILQSKTHLSRASEFSDFMAENYHTQPLNPFRDATHFEQVVKWRRWSFQKANSLLAHLKKPADAISTVRRSRTVAIGKRVPASSRSESIAFPDERFPALLEKGLGVDRSLLQLLGKQKINLRDAAICVLLHGGGLRISEVFHIWTSDVDLDPIDDTCATVRVYHPSDGIIRGMDPQSGSIVAYTRSEFLQLKYNMRPLTELSRKHRSGWKNPLLTNQSEKYMHVFWRSPEYGRLFLKIFQAYRKTRRTPTELKHPFLFVTGRGSPMSPAKFQKLHEAAIRRIGLEPAKRFGTTPHGHRHAYAQALRRSGLSPEYRRIALHHVSLESQAAYSQPSPEEVQSALHAADGHCQGLPSWGKI